MAYTELNKAALSHRFSIYFTQLPASGVMLNMMFTIIYNTPVRNTFKIIIAVTIIEYACTFISFAHL